MPLVDADPRGCGKPWASGVTSWPIYFTIPIPSCGGRDGKGVKGEQTMSDMYPRERDSGTSTGVVLGVILAIVVALVVLFMVFGGGFGTGDPGTAPANGTGPGIEQPAQPGGGTAPGGGTTPGGGTSPGGGTGGGTAP
jgi:hypothetical protein